MNDELKGMVFVDKNMEERCPDVQMVLIFTTFLALNLMVIHALLPSFNTSNGIFAIMISSAFSLLWLYGIWYSATKKESRTVSDGYAFRFREWDGFGRDYLELKREVADLRGRMICYENRIKKKR